MQEALIKVVLSHHLGVGHNISCLTKLRQLHSDGRNQFTFHADDSQDTSTPYCQLHKYFFTKQGRGGAEQ